MAIVATMPFMLPAERNRAMAPENKRGTSRETS